MDEPHHHSHPVSKTKAAKPDRATTDRVHAWVNSQQKAKPGTSEKPTGDAHSATSAGLSKDAGPKNDSSALPENPTTGTSNPPTDKPQANSVKPDAKAVSVVSTIRKSSDPADKPQLPPIADLVAEPVILPTLYNKRGRLVVPPPLKGSHEILIHQNVMADTDGLERVRDDDDLNRMRANGMLVPIPTNASTLHIDERLPVNRRYARPWTALFLDTLARQHYARFGTALQVNSAVRTVEFQQRLVHTNGNAAPAEGDTASPHLTGQAVDIAKHGLSLTEIAWLRGYLLPLVQQGKVDVEEEFQQSCFHISVYKKYLPSPTTRRVIATTHREGMGVLATGLR